MSIVVVVVVVVIVNGGDGDDDYEDVADFIVSSPIYTLLMPIIFFFNYDRG